MIKSVADGHPRGVRFIGLQGVFEPQKAPYRLCHLRFTGSTESNDRLLNPKRGIFENRQGLPGRRRDGSPPGSPEQESSLGILHIDRTLQGDVIDRMRIQERVNCLPDPPETVGHG